MAMSNLEKPPAEPTPDPQVGVVVVGNDPEVNAAIANIVRGALINEGLTSVPLESLASAEAFVDYSAYRDPDYAIDESSSIWSRMVQTRPELQHLSVPVETVLGSAVGKESILIEGAIVTDTMRISSSTRYTRTEE